ncbi:GNAT family N-acetyltransferase [Longimicrobium sp.]|uniref:GNAT family N-acetyltransferase n=1 Tax=Longimicrobium sp. TaxID=2029185 RepID=UPI003B3BBAC8
MSNVPASDPLPAGAVLADDAIELRLIHVLHPGDARPAEKEFLSAVREYHFAIYCREDGRTTGSIRLRATNDPRIVRAVGHVGYDVNTEHRGKGYATRAIRLIASLARLCGVMPLWLLIEPNNDASRRAAERAGFTFVDIVETMPEARGLRQEVGPHLRRYVLT